jgi:GPH family glycoside/pentoside/hexuronide:cation symporter
MLKNAMKNRALISIIAASVVMLLSQLTLQQMTNYIFPNYYGNASMQSVSTVAMMGAMIFAAAVSKPVARKFGKAEISAFSNLFAGLGSLLIYFLRPQNVFVYIIVQTISWLGLGVFSMVSWALITDVIDYSEVKNGVREDGSVYALYSFARKLGQAAASGVTGGLLTAIGYSEATAFDRNVTEGIFDISTLVPAIGFVLLAIILWFWYPLHKKQVEKNIELLNEKRSK